MRKALRVTLRAGIVLALAACGANDASVEPEVSGMPMTLPPGTFAEAARDDVTIHRTPDDVVVNSRSEGEKVFVVSDPVTVDGDSWIRVQTEGLFGWIKLEADDPPLVAVEPACPADAFERPLAVDEVQALTLPERLHCFGDRTVTIDPVTSRQLASDWPYGGTPDWLADEPSTQLHGRGGVESGDGLGVQLDTATGVSLTEEAWYAVQGRFDHPTASTCERRIIADELGVVDPKALIAELPPVIAMDAILWCRQQFVITTARPIVAPGPVVAAQPAPAGGSWRRIPEAPIAGRSQHGAAWTGSELIVWGGLATLGPETGHEQFPAADGAAYDPVTDTWRTLSAAPLAPRLQPGLAWTGAELLVFGGLGGDFRPLADGATYDPANDAWRTIASMPESVAPGQAWTWTGDELVVVAQDGVAAAAYDAATDTWRTLPRPPLPEDLYNIGVTWSGTEVIVLAYPNGVSVLGSGAAYDPETDRWRRLPDSPIVALNAATAPIWTGREVMVLSRSLRTGMPESVPPDTTYGSFYDPEEDAWRTAALQQTNQPIGPSAWTGDRLFAGDALYEPRGDTWLAAPPRPEGAWENPVWTGEEVLLWGGGPGGDLLIRFNDGLAYRPAE